MEVLAILGPGALGRSAAQWAAECGLEVRLLGRNLAHAQRAVDDLTGAWDRAVHRGSLSSDEAERAKGRIRAHAFDRAALEGVSILLEALPEDLSQKAPALAQAVQWGGKDLLLLSGTSALPISRLAAAAGISCGLLGFHLFVPVPQMGVVELAVPPGAPEAKVGQARGLGEALRKRVVIVADQPGFAAARMALAQGLEAIRLLESGTASAADLDALMTLGYGHPVGPLELSDRVGLDLRLRIAENIFEASGDPAFAPPVLLREKVAAGHTGRKAGRGFFVWDPQGRRM
ncbi:3-hydroxyacyl-CoA dehydrogenase family protein [Geothrix sp. 21YS21S-4]|uniref:3-hydroxyacyl-CoA dehydrogenase family protein n=1 Tax=Geothrix sp. 21YS21S-4 TaxID=3068889 RepID=UPI0027BB1563|nr:3-hydroxyacyl-CoA dehydrogenase family protein [Geothrix sp. 21YS21S-4]